MIDDTEVVPAADPDAPAADTTPVETDLDAFKKGAESINPDAPKTAEKVTPEAGATGSAPVAGATGATVAEPTPEEKAANDLKAKEDGEIRSMGLKSEKNIQRFRELSAEARKVPELTKQIEQYKPLAEEAQRFNEIIADTKAKPEQIGGMLKYLKSINTGDPASMREGLKSLQSEIAWLAGQLGEEVQGVDPVTEHTDLNAAIEKGELTRERALEVARARAQTKRDQDRTATQSAEDQRAREHNATVDAAVNDLNALGASLQSDPQYKAKLDAMGKSGTLDLIKENLPPSRWVAAFKQAYSKVVVEAPVAKPPVGAMPLRPTGGDPVSMKRVPKTDLEAFQMGAASVST